MESINLDPMAVIQAQRDKILELTDENVQLRAAVAQLQQIVATQEDVINNDLLAAMPQDSDPTAEVTDITDEMVGAEVTA